MTREERKLALYCLKANSDYHSEVCEECTKYPNCDHMGQDDVTETIIKALEQEPCEDAISRSEFINRYRRYLTEPIGFSTTESVPIEIAKSLPPVNPQPKIGHWNCGDDMFEYAICSSCKHETGEAWEYAKRNFKYCPNCGARMVEPQESENP